ncbi:MAG: hypothetical protein WBO55_05090 [Rhizobiaceae bacterium]
MAQFRYSDRRLRETLVIAAGLTAMVCGLVWMFLKVSYHPHRVLWTVTTGLVFFAFCSATMVWRWLRRETVLAVLQSGLYDARWLREPVPWDRVREIVIRQAENEFAFDVYLWHRQHQASRGPDHTIDIAPLDIAVQDLAELLSRHTRVRRDF